MKKSSSFSNSILALTFILISSLAADGAVPDPTWSSTDYTAKIIDCVIPLSAGSYPNNGPNPPASGCDNYYIDLYERPTAQEPKSNDRATYYSQVDLVNAKFGQDTEFYYFAIDTNLSGDVDEFSTYYGIELDVDNDGRGDYFISGESPKDWGTAWQQEKVRVYYDTDGGVGSTTPGSPDAPLQGNGYENLFWEEGWSPSDGLYGRVNSADGTVVEFALKRSLIMGITQPSFRAWAIKGNAAYQNMDYHDKYTFEQAGYLPEYGNIYELDNTLWGDFYPQDCCINGTKTNSTGYGLAGWKIYVDTVKNGILNQGEPNATTTANGSWRICGLGSLNGKYDVLEVPQDAWVQVLPSSPYNVTLPGECGKGRIDFKNAALKCLSGYKNDSCTGLSLSGWTINVNNSTKSWTATTDVNGFWRICNLENDTYTVCEVPLSGWTQTSSPVCYTETLVGYNITNINFSNQKMYYISGYKLDDCTGMPLPGWNITLNNATHEVSQFTGPDGRYEFCNLKPGDYTITEEVRAGYNSITWPNPVELNCSNVTYQNFTNQRLYCISGYKLDDCTKAGLPGWTVNLTNGSYTVSTSTNQTGYYEFCGLLPGAYTVTETVQDGWNAVTSPVLSLTLPCTGNLTKQNFTNENLTTCIDGYKLDTLGEVLDGWTIFIDQNNNSILDQSEPNATTNSSGYWQICGLIAGTQVNVTEQVQSGWMPIEPSGGKKSVLVEPGNRTPMINFTNENLTTCIEGYKLDTLGTELPGWTIFIDLNNNSILDQSEPNATTDSSGYWQICGLIAGTQVNVTEQVQSGWIPIDPAGGKKSVLVEPGNRTPMINFTNENLTTCIEGYKLDTSGEVLDGWTIFVDLNNNSTLDSGEPNATTDSSGYWQICGLIAGTKVNVTEQVQPGWIPIAPSGGKKSVLVEPGNRTPMINFTNENLTTCIEGYKLDTLGTELPGWTIFVDLNNNSILDSGEPNSTTNSSGYWQICGLIAGTQVNVTEQVQPGWMPIDPAGGKKTVLVEPGNRTPMINFTNENLTTCIDGYKLDTLGTELPGWTIFVDLNNNSILDSGEPNSTTNSSGYWQICGLIAGTQVNVTEQIKSGWMPIDPAGGKKSVLVEPGNRTPMINFTNENLTTCIEGYKLDTLGTELPGWTIFVDLNNNSTLDSGEPNATTNSSGYWQICGLIAGTKVNVTEQVQPGWMPVDPAGGKKSVLVEPGNRTPKINFTNENLTTCIEGYKLDTLGTELPGWTIFVDLNNNSTLDQGEPNATTNSSGYWQICDLIAGTSVNVTEQVKPGWMPIDPAGGKKTVLVEPGNRTPMINFTNENLTTCIEGYKLDTLGTELPSWTIFVDLNNNSTLDSGEPNATTNSSGYWQICGLIAGTEINVTEQVQPGWMPVDPAGGKKSVLVEPGNRTPKINFTNENLTTCIEGYKLDTSGEVLDGWTIFVDLNNNSTLDSGEPNSTTNSSGYWQICGLVSGTAVNVTEVNKPGWIASNPSSGWQTVTVMSNNTTPEVNFTNIKLKPDDPIQYGQFCEAQRISGSGIVDMSTSVTDRSIALEYESAMSGDGDLELDQENAYSQNPDKLKRSLASVNGSEESTLNLYESTKLAYSGTTPLVGGKNLHSRELYGGIGATAQEMYAVNEMEKDQTVFFAQTLPYEPLNSSAKDLPERLNEAGRDTEKVDQLMRSKEGVYNPAQLVGIDTKAAFNGTWGTGAIWHKIFYKDIKAHEMFTGTFEAEKLIKFNQYPVPDKAHAPCQGIDC